jgi:hypothetical protein
VLGCEPPCRQSLEIDLPTSSPKISAQVESENEHGKASM